MNILFYYIQKMNRRQEKKPEVFFIIYKMKTSGFLIVSKMLHYFWQFNIEKSTFISYQMTNDVVSVKLQQREQSWKRETAKVQWK